MTGRGVFGFFAVLASIFFSHAHVFAQAATMRAASVVAVWDFDNQTSPAVTTLAQLDFLNRSLSEVTLVALMAEANLKVVDRLHLQSVLAEQKLGSSSLADADSRLKLGRILGAQRMVFGSFMAVGDQIQVTVRAVDTATSQVVFADQFVCEFDDVMVMSQTLAKQLTQALAGRPTQTNTPGSPAQSNALWAQYDQALALTDAGHYDQSLDLLKVILTQHPDFVAAQRHFSTVLEKLTRQ